MKVKVVYALPARQIQLDVEMAEGATVKDALNKSGILKQFPEINLETQKVGVYGKAVALDAALEDGARIEIYRPIIADPKTVRRRPKADDAKAEA